MPLLPPRFRPAAVVLLAACAVIVAVLGALVYHGASPDALDRAVLRALPAESTPGGRNLAVIAQLGGSIPIALLTILLCYCCLALRRYRGAIMLAVSVPVTTCLTEFVLKPLIHRVYISFLSFPSGHSTGVFTLVAGIVVLLLTGPPAARAPAALRAVLACCAVAVGGAVAAGLVIAHMHYFTDTIGGAATGTGVTIAVALAVDLAADRRARRRAAAAGPPA